MTDKQRKLFGLVVIVLSLIANIITVPAFFIGVIIGWTTDNYSEPALNIVFDKFIYTFLLFSNILLTYSGFAIRKNNINRFTIITLCIGMPVALWSLWVLIQILF
jgi:hypothetical protein